MNCPIPPVMGLAKLGKMAFDGADLAGVRDELSGRFARNDGDLAALMDMCIVDQIMGCPERGLALQGYALNGQRLYQLPAKRSPAKLTLLGFAAAGKISDNTPIEFLIEDTDVTLHLYYIVPGLPLPPVPEHDLAIVLVGEGESTRPALKEVERLVAHWPRPVLNLPDLVPLVGRERLYKVLDGIPGIRIPATIRVDRATWEAVGSGDITIESLLPDGGFPVIVRPLDSHGGHGLEKVEAAAGVTEYLSRNKQAEFFLSRFVEYRSPDGLYRKYRIAIFDGKAFPSHMAMSDNWMIHYVNAGMIESAEKRSHEECFMNGFKDDFGRRHGKAMAAIADATELDYFGIDCGETPDGKLLVFEADTGLVVHNMDSPEIFPYKDRHMRALFDAFREMLYRAAGRPVLSFAAA